jgi:hypothetical protein
MSNEMLNETAESQEELVLDELTILKARADQLGISYHHKIGLEKLRRMVNDAINGDSEEEDDTSEDSDTFTEHQVRMKIHEDMMALVRVNVHCNDPAKKDWPGEIITVANSVIEAKKYVKYDTTDGYHIPKIIYLALKDKEVQLFRTVKSAKGVDVKEGYLAKAYSIEVLPPLTEKELAQLAADQRARHAVD